MRATSGFAVLATAFLTLGLPACRQAPLNPTILDAAGPTERYAADFAIPIGDMELPCVTLNACGDCNPGCHVVALGPPDAPFPLKGDAFPDPHIVGEVDARVERDGDGNLRIIPGANESPLPFYQVVIRGCGPHGGPFKRTAWRSFAWQLSTNPEKTEVRLDASSGNTETPDNSWVATKLLDSSPLDLSLFSGNYLEVAFDLGTIDPKQTPLLQHFEVTFECPP